MTESKVGHGSRSSVWMVVRERELVGRVLRTALENPQGFTMHHADQAYTEPTPFSLTGRGVAQAAASHGRTASLCFK